MKQQPNPNSKRYNGLYFYLTPELNQSLRNFSGWFNKSLSEMINILIRLGIENPEFKVLAEQKKAAYIHQKAVERLGLVDNLQNNTPKSYSEGDGI